MGKWKSPTRRWRRYLLEAILNGSRTNWLKKLDDALWVYIVVFKTLIDMSQYWLVFDNAYHLPVEFEHKVYLATPMLNFDMKSVGKYWILQLHELGKFWLAAYENSKLYKEKNRKWHSRHTKEEYLRLANKFSCSILASNSFKASWGQDGWSIHHRKCLSLWHS